MALFRPSREPHDRARHTLPIRTAIFVIGAILAVIGMAATIDWIVYLAVGVLAVGIVLRLAAGRG